ncbi:PAP2-domain-containing protein [Gloeophyllum trabeum ATCC 11539]|uniref:PAP2-domain-containing protein n=1 Tax=Gloeophyllum trabeum (strain ATCC 11539 / FP-39264 / Madison 617) TaxID=670483 RepID=S7Q9S4_GLOTA|nr:PAP2-domain-containing protein [Gloeophyllum trabeum ATCC 11539]EPQ56272.1 PAP2-domain-containing protein [Gloeophyllum trabeum ATCC 11539]
MSQGELSRASLELTHVLYDPSSTTSFLLALLTLSPILLMASYAALSVYTRELVIIEMWAGQFICEGFNWVLKRLIKQDRPEDSLGHGYGFPSSHSQNMGYFASFLMCHMYFRHRFATSGNRTLDRAWRVFLYLALAAWAGTVAYSRYRLTYHTPHQILWGLGIGILYGVVFYGLTELIPIRRPDSLLGRFRRGLLLNPLSEWIELKDGWLVYPDGGRAEEWKVWRNRLQKGEKVEGRMERPLPWVADSGLDRGRKEL